MTEAEAVFFECTECGGSSADGDGCEHCEGGRFILTRCPMDAIGPDAIELMELADLYRRGIPPVAGGALDQAAAFNAACRFVWAERDRVEAEMQARALSRIR